MSLVETSVPGRKADNDVVCITRSVVDRITESIAVISDIYYNYSKIDFGFGAEGKFLFYLVSSFFSLSNLHLQLKMRHC